MNLLKKYYQKIQFVLLTGLIIFIPLYPKFPLLNVPGTYVAIRIEDFLIALVLLFWIICSSLFNREIFKNIYFQIFLLFWFVGLVSFLSALLITGSVTPHLSFFHWLRRLEFMLLFWVAATSVNSKKQLGYLLWVVIFTTALVIFYGLGQLFLGFKVVSTVDKDFSTGILSTLAPNGRVNSTFAGHYDFAIYLSFFLILMAGVFFHIKNIWQKIGIIAISSLSFILLGFTASRISLFSAVAGIALVFFLMQKKRLILGLIIVSFITVAVIPQIRERVVATVTINLLKQNTNTFRPSPSPSGKLTIQKSEEAIAQEKADAGLPRDIAPGESTDYTELEIGRSASIRLTDEWPRAVNAFYKNPLLGTGYSSISLATDNDYLRALGETGILGFIAIMLIFYSLIKGYLADLKSNKEFKKILAIIILSIILDIFITGIFIDILEASKVASLFWIIAGLAWSSKKL